MARHHYETLQQVFDDAYRGLAAQGFVRSRIDGGRCAYRGDGNTKCAIGHCIPDNLYDPAIEGATLSSHPSSRPKAAALFDKLFAAIEREKLCDLQSKHDCARKPKNMQAALSQFASEYGLTIPSIEGAA